MPGVPTTSYATVEQVTDLARAIVNDMIIDHTGEVLTDAAPFTFPLLNEAASYMEGELILRGVTTFVKETVLTPVLAIAVTDPGVQVNISETGYFDGLSQHANP